MTPSLILRLALVQPVVRPLDLADSDSRLPPEALALGVGWGMDCGLLHHNPVIIGLAAGVEGLAK